MLYHIVLRSYHNIDFTHKIIHWKAIAKVFTDQGEWVEMLILSNIVRKGRGIPEQRVKVVRRKPETMQRKVKQNEMQAKRKEEAGQVVMV